MNVCVYVHTCMHTSGCEYVCLSGFARGCISNSACVCRCAAGDQRVLLGVFLIGYPLCFVLLIWGDWGFKPRVSCILGKFSATDLYFKPSPEFLTQGFSLILELMDSSRLSCQEALGILLCLLSHHWDYRYTLSQTALFF